MSKKPSTTFGTMESGTKFTSLIWPPSFVSGSLAFQLEESCRSKLKVSSLQKFTQKQRHSTRFKPESITFLIYVNDMPHPSHHQTNKSQFANDAGQWDLSKNIDLAMGYLQSDLDKLARWCAKWRIKLNSEKVIIFSKSQPAIRAEPASSLYGDLLSHYPHIKFLGIIFYNRMTFTKHFEEILECCNQKFHSLRILINKRWGPSPTTILQMYKQCVRPIFEYGIVSTITVSESVINTYKESRTLLLG